jgi:hypothetical protein
MKFDLNLIPSTFDSVHAALVATVAGLFFLQVLFLILAIVAIRKKCAPTSDKPEQLRRPEVTEVATAPKAPVVEASPKQPNADAALQLLNLLQNEARFVDFIKENVTAYSDADIGAAARVVHDGCAKVLKQYFQVESVHAETEGKRVTVPSGFDPASIRLTGNIVGSAPFSGTLVHRGWRVTQVKLPTINQGHDTTVIAPAEVEL